MLLIDKHENISSFWAVAQVRRILGQKKAGHTGTLDPMASGVLPVMLGGATKFCELLPTKDKAYRATMLLGVETDTLDITGSVLSQKYVGVSAKDVENVLPLFTGDIKQLPPMYSAIQKDGVRLYKLARQGVEIEREKRDVSIYSLSLVSFSEEKGEYVIDVSCSAGTYVRSLISDIGKKLGCGAVMTRLRRTKANGFSVDECITVSELEKLKDEGKSLDPLLIPVDRALSSYRGITVTDKQAVRFVNGGSLDIERLKQDIPEGVYRVYSRDKRFLGLGERKTGDEILSVKRLFIE
ncbi:MAG: tRNA pseudouridine(55) synthase TruB [Clostridiales bacterium]|nr:tRNA pseudouridine(55) synthase TruB [Clostridiales bacterium]